MQCALSISTLYKSCLLYFFGQIFSDVKAFLHPIIYVLEGAFKQSFQFTCMRGGDSETREGWPLLTAETEVNGDSNERCPFLVGS